MDAAIESVSTSGRLFEPPEEQLPSFSVSKLLVSSKSSRFRWRQLSRVSWAGEQLVQQPQKATIVIGVHGACRNNGRANAIASYGIYFDAASPLNFNACLQDYPKQTSQLAELVAAKLALEKVETLLSPTSNITDVILITDSSYLTMGMNKYVYWWQEKDWKYIAGEKVVNRGVFRALLAIIDRMNDNDVFVKFWLVPRAENTEANKMANAALDQQEAGLSEKKSEDHKKKSKGARDKSKGAMNKSKGAKDKSKGAKEKSKDSERKSSLEHTRGGGDIASDELRRLVEHTLSRLRLSPAQLESFRTGMELTPCPPSRTGQRNSIGKRVPLNQSSRGGRSSNV